MCRPIDDIVVGHRYRHALGDVDALAASIRNVGLLHPVVITPEGVLVAGARRLEACRRLGMTRVPVTVVELDEVARGQRDENAARKSFLPSEVDAIRRALEPAEREAARARMVAAHASPGKFPRQEHGAARDRVAAYAGISGRSLDKIRHVCEAAQRDPCRYGDLAEMMDRTGKVDGAYRELLVRGKAEAIGRDEPALPRGPFRVVVADPPWPFGGHGKDAPPYPTMPVDEIAAVPVREICHRDAVLWLWTTNHHLPDALRVAEAWGFEYKTMLTWAKEQPSLGSWLRSQTEHALLCTRGRPVIEPRGHGTVLRAPRGRHSEKPEEFYALVEAMCPGSKVELFARRRRKGWASHGDEARPCRAA